MEGARRAAALTSRLLAFSRQQQLAPEQLDANRLVQGMTDLLSRTLGEAIRVETVLSAGLWPTWRTRTSWSPRSSIWRSTRAMRWSMAAS